MSKNILPKTGEQIVVTVNNTRGAMRTGPLAHLIPSSIDIEGVMNSNTDADTFSIIVAGSPVPVRSIHLRNVIAINGKKISANLKNSSSKSFKIDGSKGAKYTVNFDGNKWTCSCPAGVHGRNCKHVAEAMSF